MENNEGKLRKVPGCGIFDFSDKIQSIQVDTLVTSQAKREYLAHVWAPYKNASKPDYVEVDCVAHCGGLHE